MKRFLLAGLLCSLVGTTFGAQDDFLKNRLKKARYVPNCTLTPTTELTLEQFKQKHTQFVKKEIRKIFNCISWTGRLEGYKGKVEYFLFYDGVMLEEFLEYAYTESFDRLFKYVIFIIADYSNVDYQYLCNNIKNNRDSFYNEETTHYEGQNRSPFYLDSDSNDDGIDNDENDILSQFNISFKREKSDYSRFIVPGIIISSVVLAILFPVVK